MGRKAKRKELARLLKQARAGKLYRGNKLAVYRLLRGNTMEAMLHVLRYSAPGTLVFDCDGFNHRVRGIDKHRRRLSHWGVGGHGDWVADVDQLKFENGYLSCGCPFGLEDPRSREEIESALVHWWEKNTGGWGPDNKDQIISDYRKGIHFTDEDGCRL